MRSDAQHAILYSESARVAHPELRWERQLPGRAPFTAYCSKRRMTTRRSGDRLWWCLDRGSAVSKKEIPVASGHDGRRGVAARRRSLTCEPVLRGWGGGKRGDPTCLSSSIAFQQSGLGPRCHTFSPGLGTIAPGVSESVRTCLRWALCARWLVTAWYQMQG